MAEEKPFERKVEEVIDEEFANAFYPRGNERLEVALQQIKVRLAKDLENLHDRLFPQRGYDHTDFYDFQLSPAKKFRTEMYKLSTRDFFVYEGIVLSGKVLNSTNCAKLDFAQIDSDLMCMFGNCKF